MSRNTNLHEAKKAKNDEFYTTYEDIEKELINYKDQLKGKTIYCNCDNIFISNFPKFFIDKFNEFGLKKLITTGYVKDGKGIYSDYNGSEQTIKELSGNGSFDSKECLDLLKEADVVITNPPFSIFRDYFKVLVSHDKKFLIIGSKMAYTYKDVFPYIKNGKLWTGYNYPSKFIEPNQNITNNLNGLTRWFTNLDVEKGLSGEGYKIEGVFKNFKESTNDLISGESIKTNIHNKYNGPVIDGKEKYMRLLIEKDAKPITACAWFTNIDVDKGIGGEGYKVDGLFNNLTDPDPSLIKGKPTDIGHHKAFVGPMLNNNAKYARVLIEKDAKPITACAWFTNIDVDKDIKYDLTQKYDPKKYPKYDNYDAINVDKVKDIPYDYDGVMGVPVTIVEKLGSDGLIHLSSPYKVANEEDYGYSSLEGVLRNNETKIDDKKKFDRIIIEKDNTYKIEGCTMRFDESGLRNKKYISDDSSKVKNLNNNGVVKENGELKAKFSRLLIEKDNTYKIEGLFGNFKESTEEGLVTGESIKTNIHNKYKGSVIDKKEKFKRYLIQRNNPKI